MFNVDGSEFLVILLVALLVLGPERMPAVVRKVGRIVGELRRMSSGFQEELKESFAEPLETVKDVRRQTSSGLSELRESLRGAIDSAGNEPPTPAPDAPRPAEPIDSDEWSAPPVTEMLDPPMPPPSVTPDQPAPPGAGDSPSQETAP